MTDPARARQLVEQANQAASRGDLAAYVRSLEAAHAADPGNAHALNGLGIAAQHQGDMAAARRWFTLATESDPDATDLWLSRATAERLTGDEAAELSSLDRALGADANNIVARLLRGNAHVRAGREPAGIGDYQLGLAMIPAGAALPKGVDTLVAEARAKVAEHGAKLGARLDASFAGEDMPGRFRQMIDIMAGRRTLYRSQPMVLDYPELPAIEYFDRALFPWFKELEAATDAIRAEYLALFAAEPDNVEPYVAYRPDEPVNQWQALNHNKAWGVRFLYRDGTPKPEVRDRCPQTSALIDRLPLLDMPGRGPAVFFSVLAPRTHIPPHTGATNLRSIVHLGLIVPDGCIFRVGGTTRPWREGEAFAFDDTIEHEARNDSDSARVVLILDTWNPAIAEPERALLRRLGGELLGSWND
jgi:aspartyl/asparaginyl beta-hydroxylase (cupin superfamily)